MSCQSSVFNVKAYLATGNGVTDDTATIQAAINACVAAGGGIVFFPIGTYIISNPLLIGGANVTLEGANPAGSIIQQTVPTKSIITTNSYPAGPPAGWMQIRDLGFNVTGTPSAGSVIALNWANLTMQDCVIFNCYNAFAIGQTGTLTQTVTDCWIHHCDVRNVRGTVVSMGGNCQRITVDNILAYGMGNATASTVMNLNSAYCDVFIMSECDFENFGQGIFLVATAAGQNGLTDSWFEDIIIDAPAAYALLFQTASGGALTRLKFNSCWLTSTSATAAILFSANAASSINDIDFNGGNVSATGAGFTFSGTQGATQVDVLGVKIYGCGAQGIVVAAGDYLRFRDCTVGPVYGTPNAVGIQFNTGYTGTHCLLDGNDFSGNTTNLILQVTKPGIIRNNIGINPAGLISATVPANGVVTTNPYPYDVDLLITANAGGTTAAQKNGTAIWTLPASAFTTLRLGVGETVLLGYVSAPTVLWFAE